MIKLSNYSITHQCINELPFILIRVTPSTGSLEKSFSKLLKICHKDRNQLTAKHLEASYLLCHFKGNEADYEKPFDILGKNHIA